MGAITNTVPRYRLISLDGRKFEGIRQPGETLRQAFWRLIAAESRSPKYQAFAHYHLTGSLPAGWTNDQGRLSWPVGNG